MSPPEMFRALEPTQANVFSQGNEMVFCGTIARFSIWRCDALQVVLFNTIAVRFTPHQYRLLCQLISGKPVSDQKLLGESLDRWTRENLDKRVDEIRSKMKRAGVHVMIRRILQYGYILLEEEDEVPPERLFPT